MIMSEYDLDMRLYHFMTPKEERSFYNEVLERVIKNPRFYLDRVDIHNELSVFYVSFINYYWSDKKKKKAL